MDQPTPDSRNRLPGYAAGKKRRFGRSKKQKINPRNAAGLFTKQTETATARPSTSGLSKSSKKIESSSVPAVASDVQNRIIDISILFPSLQEFLVCKSCHGSVNFSEVDIRGLGSQISITCSACSKVVFINSSKKVGKTSNAYEINRRSVLAARTLGHGLNGLKTFCGVMDLPQPISHSNYDSINKELQEASNQVASESMKAAIEEKCDNSDEKELNASGDGSWRKRGHSSLQGFSSLIRYETGKVIDVAPKQSFCHACVRHPEEDSEAYSEWWNEHQPNCSANHAGSSGKMEVDGIIEMFKRSESLYGVRYKNYIGDGDSKVFKSVCEAQPYGADFQVQKKECVGHVQKRMGTRLRNLKSSFSGKLCSDGKSIGGRGRLTAQVIDMLTKYYGNAIRANSNSVDDMSNAIWATYYHKISTDDKPQHHLCPTGIQSWCKWQKAKATSKKTLMNFKHTSSIPSAVMEAIKPIYVDLTDKNLLEKCVGGFTQNSNESFNQSVWKLIPKTSFSGLSVLEIGIYIAVICYNDGKQAFLQLMKRFNVAPGTSALQWAKNTDDERVFFAERRAQAATHEARQARRKRSFPEDDSYLAGAY